MSFLAGWLHRLTHQRRRAAAIAAVGRSPLPRRIVFLCRGNLCRSPYAAARLRALAGPESDLEVQSAGFTAPNRPAPSSAVAAAAARGLDLSAHRSAIVDRERLDGAQLIVAMEPEQALAATARPAHRSRRVILLGDLDPEPRHPRIIEDPIGQPDATFRRCYARIDRCVEELFALLSDRATA